MEEIKKEALNFLRIKDYLYLQSQDENVWISNVFYGIDDTFKIYFISSQKTHHSKHILENPSVAFSIPWYNKDDHQDRKAIQARGVCRLAKSDEEIEEGVRLHNLHFPEFKDRITVEWIKDPNNSDVWIIEPSYMKFWNDELYGLDGKKEFNL